MSATINRPSAMLLATEKDPFPRGSFLNGKKAIYRDVTIARDEIVRVFDVGNNSAKVVRSNGDFADVPRYWLRPLPTKSQKPKRHLMALLKKLLGVGPVKVGAAFEEVLVLLEILPNDIRHEVEASIYDASKSGSVYDPCGYERLCDAVVEAEPIGSRILRYVEPENLLFVFSESVEALRDALRNFPLPQSVLNAGHDRCAYAREEQRKGGNEKNPENRAIVLCKLRKAEGIAEFFTAKKKESGDKADRYEVSWGELQKLKDEIKHRCDAELIEDFCKTEGRAK